MTNISSVWQVYQDLPPIQKHIVKISSVVYEYINESVLIDICRRLDISPDIALYTLSRFRVFKQDIIIAGIWQAKSDAVSSIRCHDDIVELVFREAIREPYFNRLVNIIDEKMKIDSWYYYGTSFDRAIRDLRIGLIKDDSSKLDVVNRILLDRYGRDMNAFNFHYRFFGNPPDIEWIKQFAVSHQITVLNVYNVYLVNNLDDPMPLLNIIEQDYYAKSPNEELRFLVMQQKIHIHTLRGNKAILAQLAAALPPQSPQTFAELGTIYFLDGNYEKAIENLSTYVKLYRKDAGRRKIYPANFAGMAYVLSRLTKADQAQLAILEEDIKLCVWYPTKALLALVLLKKNETKLAFSHLKEILSETNHALTNLIVYMCFYWLGNEYIKQYIDEIKRIYQVAGKNGYKWIELEAAALLANLVEKNELYEARQKHLEEEIACKSLLSVFERQEEWQRALEALAIVGKTTPDVDLIRGGNRIVWLIDFEARLIQPREQSLNKTGKWSDGRNIAVKRIVANDVPAMTPQDWLICNALTVQSGYYNYPQWDFEKAALAMVGHPLLFLLKSPGVQIVLEKADPELIINETPKGYEVKFNLPIGQLEQNVIIKETSTRYKLVKIERKHIEIARAMGGSTLNVPSKARETLGQISKKLASLVNIHSPIIQDDDDDIKLRESDERIYFQLLPFGEGLKAEMYVKPFTEVPPYAKPGEGSASLLIKIDNKPIQVKRNFKREKSNMANVVANCSVLAKNENKDNEWIFDEIEESLQLLVELEPLVQENKVLVEWPKGERFRIKYQIGMNNFSLRAKKQGDWFNLEGEVALDETSVMQMRELLDLVQNSDSRFVALNDGSFMALTKEFRRRLNELNAYLENSRSGNNRIHNLAAFALDDFTRSIGKFEADNHWKDHIKKLKNVQKYDPQLPSTLQADLRNYQIDGFKWLSQMAYWGVGACLADDMGLGKTLQALAVILERAHQGPTLIVAPASVCQNWINEANRFAPTLQPLLFGKGDRQTMADALKPFDMLVCSYTLMQQEGEMLSKIQWATSVLDEAQAIKNQNTKRSKAAMDLNSSFRIITTGTPIENHLGELWNLFNFINPNMLGNLQSFNERFAIPIERNNDKDRRRQLQRLIQPFILRRRKNQVLEELPSKTEIALSVELSKEELAFYEAIRQSAIQKIEAMKDYNEGTQRIQILAEIMRLRQAACNPELVSPNININSSKLQLFAEVVTELLENGHKALVFSQFVGHLRIIERKVQELGIKYQYLDGQTPVQNRQKLVDDFQRGNGDLFLISLKAGGVGLNLTAADYVIIMDPWWNPAVEDQAADRAHRIGQQRPVTIYRLITQSTIEEKIVQLHTQKRDLADSLLEGTDSSGRLSSEELLRLIKEI